MGVRVLHRAHSAVALTITLNAFYLLTAGGDTARLIYHTPTSCWAGTLCPALPIHCGVVTYLPLPTLTLYYENFILFCGPSHAHTRTRADGAVVCSLGWVIPHLPYYPAPLVPHIPCLPMQAAANPAANFVQHRNPGWHTRTTPQLEETRSSKSTYPDRLALTFVTKQHTHAPTTAPACQPHATLPPPPPTFLHHPAAPAGGYLYHADTRRGEEERELWALHSTGCGDCRPLPCLT